MFSGIIEAIGRIDEIIHLEKGLRLCVEAPFAFSEDVRRGDSIAINGACLTVSGLDKNRFQVDLSPETLERTLFGQCGVGTEINLERALKFSDRIHGHLVTGHVDGIGKILCIETAGRFKKFMFGLSSVLCADTVEKGSIAVDGVSLTVNAVSDCQIETMMIPETLASTTFGWKKAGDLVQIETDLIGKYIKKWVSRCMPS